MVGRMQVLSTTRRLPWGDAALRRSAALWAPLRGGATGTAERAAATLLRTCQVLAAIGVVGLSAGHLVNAFALDARYDGLNADVDVGVFTWAGSSATFAAAFGALLVAAAAPAGSRAWPAALALILGFFSFDDAFALHERISIERIGPVDHASRMLWVVVAMPLLALAAVMLATLALEAPRAVRRVLGLALGLLVLAIGLEFLSPLLFAAGLDHGDVGYELEVVLEEGAELAAWVVAAGSLAASALLLVAGRDEPAD